jgi:hypothetical protein
LTVDMVTFHFQSSYNAAVMGCTTLSFSCYVGVYYPALDDNPVEWPSDYDVTFQATLGKTMRQPLFRPLGGDVGKDPPWIWYVFDDGSNLDEVIEDVRQGLLLHGFPFMDRMDDPARATRHLQSAADVNPDFGQLGILLGRIGSPHRVETIERLHPLIST